MQKLPVFRSVGLVILAFGVGSVAAGCGGGNPAQPSALGAPAAPAVSIASGATGIPSAAGGVLTPTDLTNRGWTCFQPPVVPIRIVCSRPNQGFPAIPPPADRPASFTFLIFDEAGHFTGPEVLIRTDLYKGQICESTGEPYVFVPIIGYYECVHAGGPR